MRALFSHLSERHARRNVAALHVFGESLAQPGDGVFQCRIVDRHLIRTDTIHHVQHLRGVEENLAFEVVAGLELVVERPGDLVEAGFGNT